MDRSERTRRIFQAAAARASVAPQIRLALAAHHRGLTQIASAIPSIRLSLSKLTIAPDWLAHTRALTSGLAQFAAVTEPMRQFTAFMAEAGRRQRLFHASGWLPHYTTPFELLDDMDDPAEVDRLLSAHYRDLWPRVRETFSSHLSTYAIDDAAKAAFTEAMDLHEAGFYKSVTLLVFPEIERLARNELHDGQLQGFASQRGLRELAGGLCPGQTEPAGLHGLALYQRLDDHLYSPVKTPEALDAARRDPVPNRHAALHGLVDYSSAQNSLNALIMMDFVFQVFSAHKTAAAAPPRAA